LSAKSRFICQDQEPPSTRLLGLVTLLTWTIFPTPIAKLLKERNLRLFPTLRFREVKEGTRLDEYV
jgi:hypothetical protein